MQNTIKNPTPVRRKRAPTPAPDHVNLLTDPQAAVVLNVGLSKLAELQRTDPDFPKPIWFGSRSKRHSRAELLDYVDRKFKRRA